MRKLRAEFFDGADSNLVCTSAVSTAMKFARDCYLKFDFTAAWSTNEFSHRLDPRRPLRATKVGVQRPRKQSLGTPCVSVATGSTHLFVMRHLAPRPLMAASSRKIGSRFLVRVAPSGTRESSRWVPDRTCERSPARQPLAELGNSPLISV